MDVVQNTQNRVEATNLTLEGLSGEEIAQIFKGQGMSADETDDALKVVVPFPAIRNLIRQRVYSS